MTDPRFAGEFAKAVNKDNKQIHKDLLKDPTYRQALVQVMKAPEMERMILDVLQSSQYRAQVMTIMQESLQNPIFRLEMLELLKKAVQEELKPKPMEKSTSSRVAEKAARAKTAETKTVAVGKATPASPDGSNPATP
ncbi:hypothetical protein PACILC2_29280 [Paenibacillus cisolokensis]|uniref:Spore germination GerD central core domain-containing protein n=1 Tax=Paenibacillus cisolokensis TaxID=1658519 RepID=A0ABQ4N830_9BACL|nr:spore germination lipoprotein GerD [Paenibacillus cisolokensis]GIQ64360.1 hypothetical protein PACILC2_29280 [Paenibacillus cisolokensis]